MSIIGVPPTSAIHVNHLRLLAPHRSCCRSPTQRGHHAQGGGLVSTGGLGIRGEHGPLDAPLQRHGASKVSHIVIVKLGLKLEKAGKKPTC